VAEALEEPVPTTMDVRGTEAGLQACLTDAINGMGLPLKELDVHGSTIETLRHGCAPLPEGFVAGVIRFAGDGSAQASQVTHTP
jgi:hypothetical protein